MKTIKNVTQTQSSQQGSVLKQYPRAKDLSLIVCHCCGVVNSAQNEKRRLNQSHQVLRCIRCNSVLHSRKPASLNRTFALVVAATILYIPANVLPMTVTDSLLGSQHEWGHLLLAKWRLSGFSGYFHGQYFYSHVEATNFVFFIGGGISSTIVSLEVFT